MIWGAVQITVLVLAVLVVIKFLVLAIKPKAWLNFAKSIYGNPIIAGLVIFILGAIVFYYLLMQLTIVQIMAAVTLGALLTALSFTIYGKEWISFASKLLKNKKLLWGPRAWFVWLIWLVLIGWAVYTIFV
jgi:hypothetical protein